MNSPRFGLLLWLTLGLATHAADLVTFAPRDGVLILRNGAVLAGRITPLGESYLITPRDGAEVRVPRTEVDFDCANLDEGYLIKRDWLETDDFQSHLALADWCLRHGLVARAADQLLVASLRNAEHPMLAVMERRLAARVTSDPSPRTKVVSYTAPANAPPLVVTDVEPALVQQFTTTIQPILFNRCASFQCHGGGASAYRLIRPAAGQVPTSRLTQRNLQATLVYVDRRDPEKSRLLSMAQQAHGRVTTAIFHEKTGSQLELLAGWVRRLQIAPGLSDGASSAAAAPPAWRPPVGNVPAADAATRPTPGGIPELVPDESARPLRRGPADAPADAAEPRDPFDAAAFNDRYHARP